MTKKKWYALVIGVAVLLLGTGTVFALTSSDFASIAATWVNNNCKSPSTKYPQKMTECYNYFKNQEQDVSINTLNSKVKQPTLLDGNNNTLGTIIGPDAQAFYNPTLNRIINLSGQNLLGNAVTIWYQSSDCSGTPYINGVPGEPSKVSLLFSDGSHNNYYIVNPDATYIHNMNVQSIRQQGDGVCVAHTDSLDALELTSVDLPFTYPIAQPIHLSYQ